MPETIIQAALSAGRYGVNNHSHYSYSEGPDRMSWLQRHPFALPWVGDCSSHFTYLYWCAGGRDPNKLNFDGQGFTGTLIRAGVQITLAQARTADAVIYFASPACSDEGVHVAFIVEGGNDPMTISMGQNGDPNYCRVSQDGRPHKFYRYDTTLRPKANLAWPPGMEPHPALVTFKPFGYGSMDKRVLQLQTRLGVRPHLPYGPKTLKAVTTFKMNNGLEPFNGVIGPKTWHALGMPG